MNRLQAALRRLATDLNELDLDWAVVGGLAVSARAEPRPTRDLDVAVVAESLEDIRWLLESADAAELRVAREALGLIIERGFDRDKDLMSMFEAEQARSRDSDFFVERKPEHI